MRLSISDQRQPGPYLAPFSHNTSVTDDGLTTTMPIARPLLKYGRLIMRLWLVRDLWHSTKCFWLIELHVTEIYAHNSWH